MIRLLPTLGQQLVAVPLARLRRGPAHPTWNLGTELLAATLRSFLSVERERLVPRFRQLPVTPFRADSTRLAHTHTTIGGRPAEVFTPTAWTSAQPTGVFFHGGGYMSGKPATMRPFFAAVATVTGHRVIAPTYRLAPEHPHPAGLDDAVAPMRAVIADGASPRRLWIGGDSAGGGLTLATLLSLHRAGDQLPAAAVLVSPWVDLTASEASMAPFARWDFLQPYMMAPTIAAYASGQDLRDPLISPIFGALSALGALPPMLVFTGGVELFTDQNARFVERVREAGCDVEHIVVEGGVHDYPLFADFFPPGRKAYGQMKRFLNARL